MPVETEDEKQIGWVTRRVSLAKAGLAMFGAIVTMTVGAIAYGTSFAKKSDLVELSEIVESAHSVAIRADAISTQNEHVQKLMIDAINRVEGKVDGLHDKFDDVLRGRRSR